MSLPIYLSTQLVSYMEKNHENQVIKPESSQQSGVSMLNNIVKNIKQCGQHNIVQPLPCMAWSLV